MWSAIELSNGQTAYLISRLGIAGKPFIVHFGFESTGLVLCGECLGGRHFDPTQNLDEVADWAYFHWKNTGKYQTVTAHPHDQVPGRSAIKQALADSLGVPHSRQLFESTLLSNRPRLIVLEEAWVREVFGEQVDHLRRKDNVGICDNCLEPVGKTHRCCVRSGVVKVTRYCAGARMTPFYCTTDALVLTEQKLRLREARIKRDRMPTNNGVGVSVIPGPPPPPPATFPLPSPSDGQSTQLSDPVPHASPTITTTTPSTVPGTEIANGSAMAALQHTPVHGSHPELATASTTPVPINWSAGAESSSSSATMTIPAVATVTNPIMRGTWRDATFEDRFAGNPARASKVRRLGVSVFPWTIWRPCRRNVRHRGHRKTQPVPSDPKIFRKKLCACSPSIRLRLLRL